MTTVTENDLKRLEDLINNRFDGVQRDIKSLDEKVYEVQRDIKSLHEKVHGIDIKLAAVDEKIQGIDIKLATVMTKTEGLKERVDDINSHLNIMTIGFLSIVGVLVTGILGIIGKLAFFPNGSTSSRFNNFFVVQ